MTTRRAEASPRTARSPQEVAVFTLLTYSTGKGRIAPRPDRWAALDRLIDAEWAKLGAAESAAPPAPLRPRADVGDKVWRVHRQVVLAERHGFFPAVARFLLGLAAEEWEYIGPPRSPFGLPVSDPELESQHEREDPPCVQETRREEA